MRIKANEKYNKIKLNRIELIISLSNTRFYYFMKGLRAY